MIDCTLYFCSLCENESKNANKCTNPSCPFSVGPLIPPHTFLIMNIQKQIQQILKSINRTDLHLCSTNYSTSNKSVNDVLDGNVYKDIVNVLKTERQSKFIPLTCNIDGVSVYTSSEQSMWTFTACINEVNRAIRVSMENIIGRSNISNTLQNSFLFFT